MRRLARHLLLAGLLVIGLWSSAWADYPENQAVRTWEGDNQAMRRAMVEPSQRPQWEIAHEPGESASLPSPAIQPSAAADEPLSLAPPREQGVREAKAAPPSATRALTTVFSSLAIVSGLFLIVVWFTRRTHAQATANLPKEVVEVLGRASLTGRQQMHLVRIGNKLLLLSVTPSGSETLTEITQAEEVDRLCGICQQNQPGSISSTFRQVLSQFGNEGANA